MDDTKTGYIAMDATPQNQPDNSAGETDMATRGVFAGGRRGLITRWRLAIAIPVVIAGLAFMFIRDAASSSSEKKGPRLTHIVKRGDLTVKVIEQGMLESSENTEIKNKVRGMNTVIFVVESGTVVKKGDILLRLDTLFIEEQINERSKYAHWSRSASEQSKADVASSKIAVKAYQRGSFRAELMKMEKDLAISESRLRTAKSMLRHANLMSERGYVSDLEVEEKEFAVTQAKLDVDVKKTEIDVLKRFRKKIQMETLKGNLAANEARHKADAERAFADASRRDRALEEFKHCTVRAPRDGLVIHPSAAKWRNAPEIEEGVNVHKDQVLLLMPDLSRMQVKIGIHESVIDRVQVGLKARVKLTDRRIQATVSSVSEVTRPAGWWTGNVVKYDTLISLPSVRGLKPGQSAEVEVIVAEYEDEILVPVAAVLETVDGNFCWVKTAAGPQRRSLQLGDTNDMFMIVKSGLQEGEEVILNPLSFVDEAQEEALKPSDKVRRNAKAKRKQTKRRPTLKKKSKSPAKKPTPKAKKSAQKKSTKKKSTKKKSTKKKSTKKSKAKKKTAKNP